MKYPPIRIFCSPELKRSLGRIGIAETDGLDGSFRVQAGPPAPVGVPILSGDGPSRGVRFQCSTAPPDVTG